MRTNSLIIGLMTAAAFSFACKRKVETTGGQEVKVEEVKLGSAVGSDKRVVEETKSFAPNDTIYVTVETQGNAPEATVTARWKFENGQVVNESTQRIVPTGAVATEFHLQKVDGFPEGKYKVEVLLNGQKVQEENFEVKRET